MVTKNDKTKVTRIRASDTAAAKKPASKPTKATVVKQKKVKAGAERDRNAFMKFIGYFKGAWYELRQVHWPTRRATWGLTGAVLLFSAFFVAFITALDAGFKFLFEQILQ